MPKSIWLIWPVVGLAFTLSAGAQNISPEALGDFKWFSNLGFPDVAGCPYVRIQTGHQVQLDDGTHRGQYINGFLLMTNGPMFRVFTLHLVEETFTNSVKSTNEHYRIGFEKLDLRHAADSSFQSLQGPITFDDDWATYGNPLAPRTEIFVLAWACWRHGLDSQAEQLYERAQKMPVRRHETTNSFRELIAKDLAYAMTWHAVVCFGEPSISRPQLLTMFNFIVTNFPDGEYHARAVKTAAMLRKMIAEDQAHARIAPTNLDQLPVQARVRELIFRLRDQNGHQYGQPGFCNIFDDWRSGHTNTPADQLVQLGYAAVPQLIQTLDDPTFTRSVGYWRDFTFSHTVLTVGDCAAAILQRITGTSFFVPTSTFSYMSMDGKAAQTKEAAEAWWAKVQKEGEKQMLIDALKAPDDNAPAQAEILCRKFPDVAVQTLERGIQATTNEWIRTQLVRRLACINDPRVIGCLEGEMKNSPVVVSRVEAASQLQRLKKGKPIAAMIHEWQELKEQSLKSGDAEEQVLEFLANADSPAAVKALGNGIRKCPVATRLDVIEAAGGQPFWFYPGSTNSPATRAAIEKLLVHELGDTEAEIGSSRSIDDKSCADPRPCDLAGAILAENWTNRYSFDLSASLRVRDRQRIQCINVWRQAHGLPLRPLPPEPSVHVKLTEATMVTETEWEERSVKPSHEFARTIAAFKNRPLAASQIVNLLMHYAAAPEPRTAGLQLRAIKGVDLTGVRLLIRLLPGRQLTNAQGYRVNVSVTLGRDNLYGIDIAAGKNYFSTAPVWSDLAKAINQSLTAKSETPFEIGVQIRVSKHHESAPVVNL